MDTKKFDQATILKQKIEELDQQIGIWKGINGPHELRSISLVTAVEKAMFITFKADVLVALNDCRNELKKAFDQV